jgi:hypothetical protein
MAVRMMDVVAMCVRALSDHQLPEAPPGLAIASGGGPAVAVPLTTRPNGFGTARMLGLTRQRAAL